MELKPAVLDPKCRTLRDGTELKMQLYCKGGMSAGKTDRDDISRQKQGAQEATELSLVTTLEGR